MRRRRMRGDASRSVAVLGESVRGGTCRSCRSILMGSFFVFVAKRDKKLTLDLDSNRKREQEKGRGKKTHQWRSEAPCTKIENGVQK